MVIDLKRSERSASASAKARILHVITALTTGGAETMLLKLASAICENYCQAVVSGKDAGTIGPRIENLGVPVYCLHLRPHAPNPFRLFGLRSIVRKFRPHLIQGWMYHGNLMASVAGFFAESRVPVVWNMRQSLEDVGAYKWGTAGIIRLGALLSRHPAAIVYNSRTGAQHHQAFGFRNATQVVIPNGFDCDRFRPDETARHDLRAELGIERNTFLVGLIARYDPLKDHPGFLRAAGLLVRAHCNVQFVLAGNGVDAKQRELREMIVREGLQGKVFLLGDRPDIERVTAALDIACSASVTEGFSNTVGEAMACGVPCVVTDAGDNSFLVGRMGIVVPPRNPQALADAIGQLIEDKPERRNQLGLAARHRIQNEFLLPLVARQYEELYRSLLPEEQTRTEKEATSEPQRLAN